MPRLTAEARARLQAMRVGVMQVFAEEHARLDEGIAVAAQVLVDICISARQAPELADSMADEMHRYARKLEALADCRPEDMLAVVETIADDQPEDPHARSH